MARVTAFVTVDSLWRLGCRIGSTAICPQPSEVVIPNKIIRRDEIVADQYRCPDVSSYS